MGGALFYPLGAPFRASLGGVLLTRADSPSKD